MAALSESAMIIETIFILTAWGSRLHKVSEHADLAACTAAIERAAAEQQASDLRFKVTSTTVLSCMEAKRVVTELPPAVVEAERARPKTFGEWWRAN